MEEKKMAFQKVLNETNQSHELRKDLFQKLEDIYGKTVISFFTSFRFAAPIIDKDADMLESVLQKTKILRGLLLIINSQGGSGLAAERIIKVCRTYSHDNFEVIIPKMAKSAATMICFGANKIHMSATSELGPIDPQVVITDGKVQKLMPVQAIIKSYDDLINKAIEVKQPIEPFLQQLQKYDARDIEVYKTETELAGDIAVWALRLGMFKDVSEKEIKKKIKMFEYAKTKAHARPIYREQLEKEGFKINSISNEGREWGLIWELYIRTDYLLSKKFAKIVESKDYYYVM